AGGAGPRPHALRRQLRDGPRLRDPVLVHVAPHGVRRGLRRGVPAGHRVDPGRERSVRRPALVLAGALVLALAGAFVQQQVSAQRRGFAPETARPAGELTTFRDVLGQVSYEARRMVAGVLYLRLDSYLHEGTPIDL